jgi:hypothetical protein
MIEHVPVSRLGAAHIVCSGEKVIADVAFFALAPIICSEEEERTDVVQAMVRN